MKKINYNEAFELSNSKVFLLKVNLINFSIGNLTKGFNIPYLEKPRNKKDDYCVNKFIFNR